MNKSIKIIGDGNCLFRCFSYFLYNSQYFHMKIRKIIVQNVANDWENKKLYIIGNEYYQTVLNSEDYIELISKYGTYGIEIEIRSFAEIYNVDMKIYFNNINNVDHSFGNNSSNFKLSLLFSGKYDSGYYNIINYHNDNIRSENIKIKYNKYNLKRKLMNAEFIEQDNIIPLTKDMLAKTFDEQKFDMTKILQDTSLFKEISVAKQQLIKKF